LYHMVIRRSAFGLRGIRVSSLVWHPAARREVIGMLDKRHIRRRVRMVVLVLTAATALAQLAAVLMPLWHH
jgi:hypothetical protein